MIPLHRYIRLALVIIACHGSLARTDASHVAVSEDHPDPDISISSELENNPHPTITAEQQQQQLEKEGEASHMQMNQHGDHDDDSDNNFCHGMFMTMFMDGFRWSLKPDLSAYSHHSGDNNNSTSSSTPPCLAYYVRTWKLDMSGKFRGAMVFSFLLALLTEGLSRGRITVIKYIHHRHGQHRRVLLTVIYALQQWLGTMIMLVSMMYSIEMLLSVVAGLMAGNFLFMREHESIASMGPGSLSARRPSSNMVAPGGGGAAISSSDGRSASEDQQGLLGSAASCCLGDDTSGGGLQLQTTRKED